MSKANNPQCPVRCVETGEIFETMIQAAAAVDRVPSAISAAIARGGKCAGCHWEKLPHKPYKIYKLTLPNGKVYIGQTSLLLSQRWGSSGAHYQKVNSDLYNDIVAFGWKNVQKEVIDEADTKEESLALERKYILEHDATNPERGYNIQTNVFASGTPEEITKHKRIWRRQYENTKNPHKTVICIETGKEYGSATEAARQLGLNPSHIAAICRGVEGRYTCGGYHWKWGSVI